MLTSQIQIDQETLRTAEAVSKEVGMTPEEVIRNATRSFLLEPLTTKECAKIAKVSERTIKTWLREGLGHSKIHRTVRIARSDLYLWLNRNKQSLSPSTPVNPVGSRGRKAKR